MNKSDDSAISTAYMNGYEDFTNYGYTVPCPYDPESKESKYWTMGFNDAVNESLGYGHESY